MPIRARPDELGPQRRFLNLRAAGAVQVDQAARTLSFPFSSETPVDMWYGTEILSHAPGAMRAGVRQQNLPLLYNHNRDDLLGVVEGIELGTDRRGHCTVRFGRDERGEWAMQQAADGVLVNVSFMYRVYKWLEDTEEETYTATEWEPYEISLVTVPADASVGVGRGAGAGDENPVLIERSQPQPASAAEPHQGANMPRFRTLHDQASDGTGAGQSTGGAAVIDEPRARAQGAEAERQRIHEIDAMCRAHNVPDDLRTGLIQKGATIEEARGAVLDLQLQRRQTPVAGLGDGYAPDLSDKEKARYSMLRAINAVLNNNWKEAGFELEVSNDIGKRMGKSTQGFYMPTTVPFAARAQYAAGATVLSGLVGNVDIPRQIGASSTFWVTEGGNLTESEATFDKVSLALKSIGTYSAITRQMLLQSTPDIEMLARADLIAQIALGLDAAALYGTGASGQPLGIANQSGVGSVVGGTNGAAITLDHLIDLETAIANANADVDSMAYLANAKTVGALKKLKSTTGQYLWTNLPNGARSATPGEVNGYPVARTNQARSTLTKGTASGVCSEIYMGNWSELLIGEWGTLEIMPNPYDATLFKQGGVLLRAMQSVDIAVRHGASFAVMSDALT